MVLGKDRRNITDFQIVLAISIGGLLIKSHALLICGGGSVLVCLFSCLEKNVMSLILNRKKKVLSILGLLLLLGCNKTKEEPKGIEDYQELDKMEYIHPEKESELSFFFVEGMDREGLHYTGEVKLKGDVGAGYIASDSLGVRFYIEIERSQEGGLLGMDTNGNVYQLAFKREE